MDVILVFNEVMKNLKFKDILNVRQVCCTWKNNAENYLRNVEALTIFYGGYRLFDKEKLFLIKFNYNFRNSLFLFVKRKTNEYYETFVTKLFPNVKERDGYAS